MIESLLVPIVSLFLVLNAIGNVPLFVAILTPYEPKRQAQIITREMLIALFILFLFGFCGDAVLMLLGISHSIIRLGGGLLLLLVALDMIFPKGSNSATPITQREPIIVPLATPITAGPGAMSFVMVLSKQMSNWELFWVVLAAWIPAFIITYAASYIKYLLGERGLLACQKLGGMLITLIAVNMLAQGAVQMTHMSFKNSELTPAMQNALYPQAETTLPTSSTAE